MNRILRDDEAKKRYELLKKNDCILGEFVVGSQAYGTALPTSDVDKQFIYIDSLQDILSGNFTEKIELTKDYVGYEIGRFMHLLGSANPNILDLTKPTLDCIFSMHPLYKLFIVDNAEKFLTKQVKFSFGSYAVQQIKKARGENKKFRQEMEKERKGLLDFCWVTKGQGSMSLKEWLKKLNIHEEACGCVAIDHMKNCYHLFYDANYNIYLNALEEDILAAQDMFAAPAYNGIVDKDDVQIVLSSIPKGKKPAVMFYANYEGFSKYCKDYREYWNWEENKNEERFKSNLEVGCLYDTKNMAHCHRLLDMAIEILRDGELNIRRKNREQLMAIRQGEYSYEQLIADAEEKTALIEELYLISTLPEKLDEGFLPGLLLNLRTEFYFPPDLYKVEKLN